MFFDIMSPWQDRAPSARVSSPGRGARRSRRKWAPSVERFEERTLLSGSTALAASPNPSTVGQPVAFTATVVSGLPSPPSGTVAFFDNATSSSEMALLGKETVGPSGTTTFTTSSLGVGIHVITASYYSPNVPFNTSTSAPLTQVVKPITSSTTTAVASSPGPSTVGQKVTFTATVTPTSGTEAPTGTVQFFDGTTRIGSGTLNATTGTTTFATSSLAWGNHSITAQYLGDQDDAGSTSAPLTQWVAPDWNWQGY